LTPLGDPPLFLGFLRGVPFFWTLHLLPEWAAVSACLLGVFYVVDVIAFRREDIATPAISTNRYVPTTPAFRSPASSLPLARRRRSPSSFFCGYLKPNTGVQEAGMLLMAGLSLAFTSRELRQENSFPGAPIVEVAVVFAGIFATMIPALADPERAPAPSSA